MNDQTQAELDSRQQEREEDRRWWLALLLLLLFACAGLYCTSQVAILTGFDQSVAVSGQIASTQLAAYNLQDEDLISDFGRINPEVAAEATRDAEALILTPDTKRGLAIVRLPATSTPFGTATATPRPTFTPADGATGASPTPQATDDSGSTPAPLGTPTATPDGGSTPGIATATPSATPVPGTATPTTTGTPPTATTTNTPRPTFTATPTGPAGTPTVTNTPRPTFTASPTGTGVGPTPGTPTTTGTPSATLPVNTNTPTTTPIVATNTPIQPTNTPDSATATNTPVIPDPTSTFTPTPTETFTPTPTPTETLTPTPTTIPPTNGVVIAPDNSSTANPGDVVQYSHTVTNTGSTADVINLGVSSNQGYTVSVNPTSLNLAAGASGNVTVQITIPGSASAGTQDTTTVTATSSNDGSVSDTATNITTIGVIAGVDIEPPRNSPADPGQAVQYSHTVTNTGNAADVINLGVSSNQGYAVSVSPTSLNLAAGASGNVTVQVTVPANATGDTVDQTTVTATSSNNGAESDLVIDTTTVNAIYGVIIEPDNAATADPGEAVIYNHTITNLGNVADTFDISALPTLGFPATPSQASVTLNPNESTDITVEVVVPVTSTGNVTETTVVRARSQGNTAEFDDAFDETSVNPPPPINFDLNAAEGDGLVSLGWLNYVATTGFEVRFAINSGPWQSLSTTGSAADRYYHNGVTNGSTYHYQVIGDGGLAYSNIASVTPRAVNRTIIDCTVTVSVTIGFNRETCEEGMGNIDSQQTPVQTGTVFVNLNGELIVDFGADEGIVDGTSYDFSYFEWASMSGSIPGIGMNFVTVKVSPDNSNWTTVFGWGSGITANSNIGSEPETDGQFIPATTLYNDPGSPPPNWATGVAVDISPMLPAGIKYRYVQITPPGNQAQVDAIYRIN